MPVSPASPTTPPDPADPTTIFHPGHHPDPDSAEPGVVEPSPDQHPDPYPDPFEPHDDAPGG